jgi:hypothetical protein
MHKSVTKCKETQGKWCKNKHGASKIIDMFETYQSLTREGTSSLRCRRQRPGFDRPRPRAAAGGGGERGEEGAATELGFPLAATRGREGGESWSKFGSRVADRLPSTNKPINLIT